MSKWKKLHNGNYARCFSLNLYGLIHQVDDHTFEWSFGTHKGIAHSLTTAKRKVDKIPVSW